jgi:hypothetical protein
MDSDTKNLSYLREEVWPMLLIEMEQNLTVGICCEYHIWVPLLQLLPCNEELFNNKTFKKFNKQALTSLVQCTVNRKDGPGSVSVTSINFQIF